MNELAAVLASQAPRQQAARILDLLVARTRAEAGAVFAVRDDDLIVFASSRDIAATRITQATELWTAHRDQLRKDGTAQSGEAVLAPIRDGEALVALVYLANPQGFEPVSITTFADALTKAVRLDTSGRTEDVLDVLLGRPEGERERLAAILNRNEGNIARVARLLGVTRRTIYLRMQRFGVPRVKMPRTNTPRRVKTPA